MLNKIEKTLVFAMIFIFLISLSSATIETLGTFKQGEDVELLQAGTNFTYCNITSVRNPNSSPFTLLENVRMTQDGTEYNYTLNSSYTDLLGTYTINGFCTNGTTNIVWAYNLDITYTGFELNTATTILYISSITILIFILIFILFSIPKLPKGDNTNDEGNIMNINNLKYLRPILYGLSWGLMLAIVFMVSNIAFAFLTNEMIGKFFFALYRIMFVLTFPMILIWFLYIFKRIFEDKEVRKLIDRGVDVGGTRF